jgi:hypothetical protein
MSNGRFFEMEFHMSRVKVTKEHELVWREFAAAAISGLLASGKWDRDAAENAAKQADSLLKEFDARVKMAG